jgi:hypothetical protein
MKKEEWFKKAERFVRSTTESIDGGEFQRLFDRDAPRAYSVVTRDHDRDDEPKDKFWKLLYRIRVLFLGLAYKLTPPRRLLFVICLVAALFGVMDLDIDSTPTLRISFLYLLSIAGLVFLLVLELADRVVVRDELEVARELQRELLPHDEPEISGYSFTFSYRTANTIGGDYYDFLPLEDGRLAVVVGDASGHGIAAGLLMAIANSALKIGLDLDPDVVAVTRMTNRALCGIGGRREFMTLFCGILETDTGKLRYVCAGHPYPYLLRSDGEILELGTGGFPLGMRSDLWGRRDPQRIRRILRVREAASRARPWWLEPHGPRPGDPRAQSVQGGRAGAGRPQPGGDHPGLARLSHQLPAAGADAPHPEVFSRLGVLGIPSSMPPRPSDRKPVWARHLGALATKPGEICALGITGFHRCARR